MRLIPRLLPRSLASERGFSMIIVMGVMAASSLFVAAAFAAANGDLPLTRDSQDRKQAYAAAEAGINLYQFHLNQDPDYWTRCTSVPAPNGTENQPVNQVWDGVTPAGDPRRWRNVAGRPTQYTLELLPAPGKAACALGDISSMLNPATGTFRIRSTGRPRNGSDLKRSVVASFRRRSFLDFLYFTDYETTDPINYATTYQGWARRQRAVPPAAPHHRRARQRRLPGDPVRRRRRDLGPVPHERQHPDVRHAGVRSPRQGGLARVHPAVPGLVRRDATRELVPRGVTDVQHPTPLQRHEAHDADDQRARWRPSPRPTASSSPARRRSASTRAT